MVEVNKLVEAHCCNMFTKVCSFDRPIVDETGYEDLGQVYVKIDYESLKAFAKLNTDGEWYIGRPAKVFKITRNCKRNSATVWHCSSANLVMRIMFDYMHYAMLGTIEFTVDAHFANKDAADAFKLAYVKEG